MFKHRFIHSTLSYWKSPGFNRLLRFQFCFHLTLFSPYGHLHFFRTSTDENAEISEKVQKSLITPLPTGRQGLGTDYTDSKWIET